MLKEKSLDKLRSMLDKSVKKSWGERTESLTMQDFEINFLRSFVSEMSNKS